MDTERNEDLNPRSEEIEKKIDAMLDPSIPDVPDLGDVISRVPKEKPEKVLIIKPSLLPADKAVVKDKLTAPEVPKQKNTKLADSQLPPSAKDSKKIIIPIEHHDGDELGVLDPTIEAAPKIQLLKEKVPNTAVAAVENYDSSSLEAAEKLDEAIAELSPVADVDNDTERAVTGAPDLDESVDQQTHEILDELLAEPDIVADESDIPSAETELPITDPVVITDPQTDKAVAEIVASESDEILEIEDAVRDTDELEQPQQKKQNFRKTLAAMFRKPMFRWALVLVFIGGGTATAAVPTARYFALNSIGIRVSSTLIVVDESTKQPLKNVEVQVGDISVTTNQDGRATLNKVRLGNNALTISKRAFAPVTKTVVMGLGSNPLGEFGLVPTGTQYTLSSTDFLSGKPLSKVAASSGQADALSDDKGVIKLTIDKPTEGDFKVMLSLAGYRTEEVTISPDDVSAHPVKLVQSKKHVYVSKRSGKYDVYSSYIDGEDEKVVVAGSGNERDDMVLVPHPKDNIAAYVSTRPGQKNSDGFVLSNLVVINLDTAETSNVGSSEQIKIVSWAGDRLVYVTVAAGASAETPDRYRLVSYNYKDSSSKELAKGNFFNDVIGIADNVYYAPSSAYQAASAKLYRINADGTNNQTLYDKEVWNIFRTTYDHLALSIQQQWYDYRLGDKQPTKLNAAPADQVSRVYVDSPDSKYSAWIDSRDGKGVLLSYDTIAKTDKTIKSESGLSYPVRWLSDSVIVYRIKNNLETADYAVSINGGEAVKINDVTNTIGLSRWL